MKKGIYYNAKRNEIVVNVDGVPYEIGLDRMQTCSQVLDWIAQLSGKVWMSNESLGAFVREIDRVLFLQQNYCSWGHDRGKVNAIALAKSNVNTPNMPIEGVVRESQHV